MFVFKYLIPYLCSNLMDTLYQLKECFTEDFAKWLSRSNNPELLANGLTFDWNKFHQLEKECLQDILDILIREPKADYFWYGVQRSQLFYDIPTDESPVPGDSLRVDKDKIKHY